MIAKIIAARNRGPAEIVIASSVMANLIPSSRYSRTIRYSVANETPIGDARNSFLRELIPDAHMSDPTRLISAALQNHETSGGNRFLIHIDDPIANDLDVMGNNEYMGWYVRRPEDADLTDLASKYDKPSS